MRDPEFARGFGPELFKRVRLRIAQDKHASKEEQEVAARAFETSIQIRSRFDRSERWGWETYGGIDAPRKIEMQLEGWNFAVRIPRNSEPLKTFLRGRLREISARFPGSAATVYPEPEIPP